jgi:hypothetical protein
MKFDIGSFWRTRDGKCARVLCNDLKSEYPVVVAIEAGELESVVSLDEHGHHYEVSAFDLVGMWVPKAIRGTGNAD